MHIDKLDFVELRFFGWKALRKRAHAKVKSREKTHTPTPAL